MTSSQLSVPDQIRQLEDARKLVLGDVSYYSRVIQATLPIIGPSSQVEFRRWGTEFLSEAFATPALPLGQKETLSLLVLETLKLLIEDVNQDTTVLRSAIQAASSIYPLTFRWIINNSYDTATWERMTAIKMRIIQIWDTAPTTIRICCIKFAQRVVLAQTASINPEPRRGDPLDISLVMLPPNHPVLDRANLEPEAFGLLDRMLQVLQENSGDALVVNCTLNTLSVLIRGRPATSGRILSVVMNFNPFHHANQTLTPKLKTEIKSMEKTTRMLLMHLSRRDPHNPQAGRLQQHAERLMRTRAEVLDEGGRKRALAEQGDQHDPKRQRLGASMAPELHIKPLGPGPHTLADVYTFAQNEGVKKFDVASAVPAELTAKICVATLARLDSTLLDQAINGVRDRLTTLQETAQQPINPETAPLGVEEDEDDYDPDYNMTEDPEQLQNKMDSSRTDERRDMQQPAALGSLSLPAFKLPPSQTLRPEQATKVGQGSITRVFGTMRVLTDPTVKRTKAGINRFAAHSGDRDSWVTIISRLATRASSCLDDITVKDEGSSQSLSSPGGSLSNSIREMLYTYVLEDFRKRIDVAMLWLNEEWQNDLVQQRAAAADTPPRDVHVHYEKWALRLLDGFLPYLHSQDKVLTRYLSELPGLNKAMLSRVKSLCRDPTLVNLVLTSLLYVVMFRPPVKQMALDTIQEIWTEFEDSRPMAAKYLQKFRPEFLAAAQQEQQDAMSVATGAQAVAT